MATSQSAATENVPPSTQAPVDPNPSAQPHQPQVKAHASHSTQPAHSTAHPLPAGSHDAGNSETSTSPRVPISESSTSPKTLPPPKAARQHQPVATPRNKFGQAGKPAETSKSAHSGGVNSQSGAQSNDQNDSESESKAETDGDASNAKEAPPALDFAKRDVDATSHSRSSFSQLSSMTVNSPERIEIDENTPTDEPVLEADDQERIRNPVGAAFRRSTTGEEIGFRQPFGEGSSPETASPVDTSHTNGGSGGSGGSGGTGTNGSTNGSNNGSTLGASRGSGIGTHDLMPFGAVPSTRRTKRYEPARVVLHKSDSGIGVNLKNGGASEGGYFDSGTYTAPYSAGSANGGINSVNCGTGKRGSVAELPIVSQSLVSSIANSPDDLSQPLRHLREPKQPMYIPAVLRPTDFGNYTHTRQQRLSNYQAAAQRKPITQHWVLDANADSCQSCHRDFTLIRRRHHCRKCGGIFCAQDSRHTIGLDRILNFSILGIPCRACDSCAENFAVFCLEAPRLQDGGAPTQQPLPVVEPEDIEVGGGGDWSTF